LSATVASSRNGVLPHREGHQAREGADQRGHVLVDEARRLRVAHLDLVLGIPREQHDLRPAERLDAARAVDLVHRQLQTVERQLRLEGERAGDGQDVADLDLARLGAANRGRAERGHGARGADSAEEAATAGRGSIEAAWGLRHRVLRREMVGLDGAQPSIPAASLARRRPARAVV
jgi:hypothetical protein